MSRTILVTGAGGFVGSRLVPLLTADAQASVVGTWRNDDSRLDAMAAPNFEPVRLDVGDPDAVRGLMDRVRPDAVVHAAAYISGANDADSVRTATRANVDGTAHLVAGALDCGCPRFVFCSTISVYAALAPEGGYTEDTPMEPDTAYGWSKAAGEDLLRLAADTAPGFTAFSLRLAGIHGPGRAAGVVYHLIRNALAGNPLKVNEPDSAFNLLFADDAARAIELCLNANTDARYNCWNVGGRPAVTLLELARRIKELTGSDSPIEVPDTHRNRNRVMAVDRIADQLGFEPASLDDNLRRCIEHLRNETA